MKGVRNVCYLSPPIRRLPSILRMFDTRKDPYKAKLAPGAALSVPFVGVDTIPATAKAVSFSAALPEAEAAGFFTAWPEGEWQKTTSGLSNLQPIVEETAGIVRIGSDGQVRFLSNQPVHVAVDVD